MQTETTSKVTQVRYPFNSGLCKVSTGKIPSSLGPDLSDLDMTVDWSRNVTIASTSTIAAIFIIICPWIG